MRQLGLVQVRRQLFGILDGGGADQNRLAALVAVLDVEDDRLHLFVPGLEHLVHAILADHLHVGGDHHRLQVVDLLELVGFRIGRPGHPRQLLVHPEVVLEGDGGKRLVFALDARAFLGFHRLVQAVGPAPPGHQASGELIDDDDFVVLHDVVLIAVVQRVSTQGRVHVMHERDVGGVVQAAALGQQAGTGEQLLGVLVPGFGEQHLVRLLVHREVARLVLLGLAGELGDQIVDLVVQVGGVLGLTGDDQRRARFVDEDGVDLVDDGVGELALHPVARAVDHVVAQVVEAKLVVGPIGDVRGVGLLLGGMIHLRQVHPHGQAEKAEQPAHPGSVAAGQVVVDRDHVHTFTGQGVQIGRQRGHQRLALAGAHLRDLAVVQDHAADQLDVEVAHVERALSRLPNDGEGLRQQLVQRLAVGQALLESRRLGAQLRVGQALDLRLEHVDGAHVVRVALDEPIVAAAEDFSENSGDHACVRGGFDDQKRRCGRPPENKRGEGPS